MSKKYKRARFGFCIGFATVAAILIPNIFSATSSLDLASLKGPVLQQYPPLTEEQRNRLLIHSVPPPKPPPPKGTTLEEKNYLNDETTKMDGRTAFQNVVDSTSIWSIYQLEDPRHLVIGCPAEHAWVFVDTPSQSLGCETRIGRVVTTNWKLDRYDSLEGNAELEASMMLLQLNPNELETIVNVEELDAWSIFSECPTSDLEWKVAVEQKWGWPFRSTFSVLWLQSSGWMRKHNAYIPLQDYGKKDDYPTHAFFISHRDSKGVLADSRHFAIGIFPLGLIGNIAAYTIANWLALTVFMFMKYKVRIKRGRCPNCNYVLNADLLNGCPECGWLRTQLLN